MSIWDSLPDHRLLVDVSLWSADFTRFAEEIARLEPYADLYYIDVSDGHFVPGFLFFADLVQALRPLTRKPFHVPLMTDNPLSHLDDFIGAGADILTVPIENGPLAPAALSKIRQRGVAAGLALGLDTPPQAVLPYLDLLDVVLLMGTPIGVKGVEPSRLAPQRIRKLRQLLELAGYTNRIKITADGGIRKHTVPALRAAGADLVVAGSLAFKSPDLPQTFNWLWSLPVELC